MKCFLLHMLAGLSLLLCVATVVMWVRSYWTADITDEETPVAFISVFSDRGLLRIRHDTLDAHFAGDGKNSHGWLISHQPAFVFQPTAVSPTVRWDHHLPGFWWQARNAGGVKTGQYTGTFWWAYWQVVVPYPAVVVLLAILPALAIRRIQRDWGRGVGFCAACGYDLRATPDRCPECGTIPQSSNAFP